MFLHKTRIIFQTRKIKRAYKEITGQYYPMREDEMRGLSAEEIQKIALMILKEISEYEH
jgi:hypothetical protein